MTGQSQTAINARRYHLLVIAAMVCVVLAVWLRRTDVLREAAVLLAGVFLGLWWSRDVLRLAFTYVHKIWRVGTNRRRVIEELREAASHFTEHGLAKQATAMTFAVSYLDALDDQ